MADEQILALLAVGAGAFLISKKNKKDKAESLNTEAAEKVASSLPEAVSESMNITQDKEEPIDVDKIQDVDPEVEKKVQEQVEQIKLPSPEVIDAAMREILKPKEKPAYRPPVKLPKMELSYAKTLPVKKFTIKDEKRFAQLTKLRTLDFTWTRDGELFGINLNDLKSKVIELESKATVQEKEIEILESQTFEKRISDEILALGDKARNLVKTHQQTKDGSFFYITLRAGEYNYVSTFTAGYKNEAYQFMQTFKKYDELTTIYNDTYLNWEAKLDKLSEEAKEASAAHYDEKSKPLSNQAEIDRLYAIYQEKKSIYYQKRDAYYANKTDETLAALNAAKLEMNNAFYAYQAERDKPRDNQEEIDRLYAIYQAKRLEVIAHNNLRRELGLYGLAMYSDEYLKWREEKIAFQNQYKIDNANWNLDETTRSALYTAMKVWEIENPQPVRYLGIPKEEALYINAIRQYMSNYALSLIPENYKTSINYSFDEFGKERKFAFIDSKRLAFAELGDSQMVKLEKFYGGGFNKSQALDDLALNVSKLRMKADELNQYFEYGKGLFENESGLDELATILFSNYSENFRYDLDRIEHDFQVDLWENEMRPASEKALRYPADLTGEQIEYLIARSFCIIRLDLAKTIKTVVVKSRFTYGEVVQGVPAEFIRWKNLIPTKDNRGTIESAILKMLSLLYSYKPTGDAEVYMKNEIAKMQRKHIELYPEYPLNFEMMKIQATFLNRVWKYRYNLIGYYPNRLRELEKEYYTTKIQQMELGLESDISDESLKTAKLVASKMPIDSYVEVAQRFFFREEEITEDKKLHQQYIDHFNKILSDLNTKDDLESQEQAVFLEKALLPFFTNTLHFKKEYYGNLLREGKELIKEQELQRKIIELDNAIASGKYVGEVIQDGTKTLFKSKFVPTKEFMLPVKKGNMTLYNDQNSLIYAKILRNANIVELIKNSPIDEKTTKLLLSNIDDYPMDNMTYLDLYIKLASKAQEIADRFIRKEEYYAGNVEFAFVNMLYFFLLTKIRVKIDVRSMFDVNDLGEIGKFTYNYDASTRHASRTFHPHIYNNVVTNIKRIESFMSADSYDRNWLWKKLIKNFEPSKFKSSDLLNDNIFTNVEILVIKHSYIQCPTPQLIFEYANEKDLNIRDAIANMDKFVIPVMSFISGRLLGNINLDHDDWIKISPIGRELAGKYSAVKYQMLKAEKTAVDGIFASYIDYLEYYEKHGTDEGWKGQYAYLFKKDSPRFAGRYNAYDNFNYSDLGTMDGLFDDIVNVVKKAVKVVKSPIEKARDVAKTVVKGATVDVISPITGTVKESLTQLQRGQILEAIKTTKDGLVKDLLIKRLNNAMSELEEAAIRPAGRLLKKGTYELIPRSAFQAFNRLTKIPEHLVKGDLDKVDFREATADLLQATMGAGFITRIAGKQVGKGLNSLTKNVTFFEKLDLYSGGLLSSTANISLMAEEIADGKDIDKQYLLMSAIDIAKVGAVAVSFGTAGPVVAGVGLATQVTTNAVMAETDWVEDEKTRMALSIVAAAASSYAASAATATQGAGQIVAEAGTGAATSAAAGAGAGAATGAATQAATQTTVKMTFGEALKQAAINESKSFVSKEAAKKILKESGMSDSEIAVLAVGIGVTATVAVIGNSDKEWSQEVIARAKKTAIVQAEKRADKELKKIDPNLSVEKLKKLYDIAQGDVIEIIEEKKQRLKQYIQSGELADDAKAEAERWAKREAKKRLERQYAKYEDEFLDYLMERFGVQPDYDKYITPQVYLEYSDYIILLEEKRDVIVVQEIIKKRNNKKKVMVGAAAVAAAVAFNVFAGE